MPGRGLMMTEYRRSYRPSQFRCASTTYYNNLQFRLQQLQRFHCHTTDPFIWPDDEDEDDRDQCGYVDDDVTEPSCDQPAAGRSRRAMFEPAHQFRHRQLKNLYERQSGRPEMREAGGSGLPRRSNDRKDSVSKSSECGSESRCSTAQSDDDEDDRSSVVHVLDPSRDTHFNICRETKQTQTPQLWCPTEKPPFALYGHRSSGKKTHNIKASTEISSSAVRARLRRQMDTDASCARAPSSTSLRRVDRSVPVLVRSSGSTEDLSSGSAWTSEYNREYRPYEQSRYHAAAERPTSRHLHRDLKPSTPRTHRSYLVTC